MMPSLTRSTFNRSTSIHTLTSLIKLMVMIRASLSLLTSLFLILALTTPTLSTSKCSEHEANVLLKLKRSLGNPTSLSTWNKSTDCCQWNDISCDGNDVTHLTISDSDATGTISHSIGKLTHLKILLIMFNPNLKGEIPPSVGKLINLEYVRIIYNPKLTGSIPTALCKLKKLTNLNLDDNQLTGSVPGCFGNSLTEFTVRNNKLTGPIPASFFSTSTAKNTPLRLFFNNNNLTGAIPASLGKLSFETIDLSINQFTDARVLFGEHKKTKSMFLHYNELAFDLSKVKFPLTLEELFLQKNKLTGSIPKQISKLKDLKNFYVNDNKLCGPIPSGPYLKYLDRPMESFARNKCFCGAPLEPCH